ncbi:MAG TPA: hypothetical protein VFW94_14260 [Candidatus Acidoferrales bacterium]|nr:hypothetical protein [Candidatus Acidoferrales bacterium]
METITAAMIAYCVVFAGLVVGISVYRGMKRKREMQAFAGEMRAASAVGSTSGPQSPAQTDSPHDTPSAKHAA